MAPDSKPASPSPVAAQNQKTEFLIQADDQTSYELWKSKLEKVTRPSDECTVSVVVFFSVYITSHFAIPVARTIYA